MILRFLLLNLILCGCLKDETISGYVAQGAVFELQSIDDRPFPQRATLTFPTEGQLAGEAPCNRYSGAQTVPYPWFRGERIVSTKRACPDLRAEQTYLAALSEMSLAEVSGSTLILSNDEGRKLVFTARN